MKLYKLLAITTLFFILLLIPVQFIEIIFSTRSGGTLIYTRVSGDPISSIRIYLPLSKDGENIFKISYMEAKTASGYTWTVNPGPTGLDEYPDYWLLTGPPIYPGDELTVNYVLEEVRDIDYESYPWRVVSDREDMVYVTVEKSLLIKLVTLIEDYRLPLTVALLLLALTTVSLSLATWIKLPAAPEFPLESLYKATDELKERAEEIKDKMRGLKGGIRSRREELAKLQEMEEELQNKRRKLNEELTEERRRIQELSNRGSVIQVGFGGKIVKISDRIRQYARDEIDELNREYREKLSSLNKDYEKAKTFIKSKSDELRVQEKFRMKYDDLERWRITRLDNIVKEAEKKLEGEIGKHREAAEKCEEELDRLQSELSKIKKRRNQVKEEIREAEAKLRELGEELKKTEEEIGKNLKLIEDFKRKIVDQIGSLRKRIDQDISDVKSNLEKLNQLRGAVSRYRKAIDELTKKYDDLKKCLPGSFCKQIEEAINRGKAHLSRLRESLGSLEKEAKEIEADLRKLEVKSSFLDEVKDKISSVKMPDEFKKLEGEVESFSQSTKTILSTLKDKASRIASKIRNIYQYPNELEDAISNLETISGCLNKLSEETRLEILKWLDREAERKGLTNVSDLLNHILEVFGPMGEASSKDDCMDCLRAIRLAYIFKGLQDDWMKIRKLLKKNDPKVFEKLYDPELPENIKLSFLYEETYMEDKQLNLGKTIPVKIDESGIQLVNVEFLISRAIDISKIVAEAKFAPPTLKPGVGVAAGVLQLMYGVFVDWASAKILEAAKRMLLKQAAEIMALEKMIALEKPCGHLFLPDEKTVYGYCYDENNGTLWIWIEEYKDGKAIKRRLIYSPGKTPSMPPVVPKPLKNVEEEREKFLKNRNVKRLLEELRSMRQ